MSDKDGTNATPDKSNAPASITYNFGGEEITVDLTNPDQLKQVTDLLSKGRKMETIAEEKNRLKAEKEALQEKIDKWENRLDAARDDPTEFRALVTDLEEYIGRPLTQVEKQDLQTDIDDLDDPVLKLQKQFEDYKAEQERKEQLREKKIAEERNLSHAKQLVAELDRMEADKVKYPGFDREAVYNKAREDGTTNFEMVYYFLNKDQFIKAEREKIENEYKELTDKRKAAATESDTTPASPQDAPKTFKKFEEASESVKEDIKKGNLSLFSD